jgi:hypothetical protein
LLASLISVAKADIIISGSGPFGTVTDAEVAVPAGGNVHSNYSGTFDVTVTGLPQGDLNALYFAVNETADNFSGSPGEYQDSWSSLLVTSTYSPFPGGVNGTYLATPLNLPDGSFPISCGGIGRCGMWVGETQQLTFTAVSTAYYLFGPLDAQMSPTYHLANVESSVTIEPTVWLEDITTGDPITSATVTFTPVDPPDPSAAPEPGTAVLMSGALLVLLAYGTRMTRVAPAAPPTTTR